VDDTKSMSHLSIRFKEKLKTHN